MKVSRMTAAIAAMALCLFSCADRDNGDIRDFEKKTFTASAESQTRTSLNDKFQIIWNTSDSINVFTAEGKSYTFRDVTVSEDGKEAQFSGSIPISDGYCALCPANPDSYYEVGCIFTRIPSEQNATEGGFDPKANIAVSVTNSDNLFFRNVGSLIGFKINNDGIVSVTLSGSEGNGGDMTGDCGIEIVDGIPQASTLGGENYVTLHGTFEKGKTYYAVVYPGKYTNLEIIYVDDKGRTATFNNSTTLTVNRNEIKDVVNLTVKEEDWEEVESTNWTLVTSESALVAGNNYIMAYNYTKNNVNYCNVASKLNSNVLTSKDATSYISTDKKTFSSTPDGALILTLGGIKNNWTFKNSEGAKLGCKSEKNLIWDSGTTTWKITIDSGNATIASTTTNYGRFAYNESSPRFTTYKTFGANIQLYSRANASIVNTVANAEDVTKESATLKGSYICIKSVPKEAGFYYGTSETAMTATVYASTPTEMSASFSADLTGLSAGTTYYFKAFVKEGNVLRFGEVSSFTTQSGGGGGGTGKADYCWPELPAQTDADRDGIDDINPDYYYSHTMRADASKIRNFSCCYSKSKIHPVWVAAPMHSCYKGGSGRNDSYQSDPNIKCTQNGKFDGYTRGHMIGSADRTVSVATNRQAFYYSNIGAQLGQPGFNTGGGSWNNLESKVDSYLCQDTLYQVIGCIFDTFKDKYGTTVSAKKGKGSAGEFQVPTAYYKVLLRTKQGNSGKSVLNCSASELQCVAFILGHYHNKSHVPSTSDMYTVEEVEKLTGLTFFVNVPNAPKGSYSASDWGL